MAKTIKNNIALFFKNLVTKWLEDFFILVGLLIVIWTTYQTFVTMVGNYSLGIILLLFGFLLAKK